MNRSSRTLASLCALAITFALPTLASAQPGPRTVSQEHPTDAESESTANDHEEPLVAYEADPSSEEDEDAQNSAEDIVVTGTRSARAKDDAPVRTQTIRREQIEERNARNLAEAINYTSGVRVETNCQNCGFTQLRLNGLNGAYTQILIDGLPTFSGLAGVYGLEQLPAEIVDRIEIVKGGGSALYGPSAVAGVVNVITRAPRETFASALLSYEHVGLRAPDLRLSGDGAIVSLSGKIAAHFFATARTRDELDLNDDNFSDQTRLNQLAAGTSIFVTPAPNSTLRLAFHALHEYRRGGDNLDLPPHEADIAEELQTQRLQAEIRWNQQLSKDLRYSVGYALAHTHRRSYYGAGGGVDPTLPPSGQPDDDFRENFETERLALGGYGKTTNPLHVGDAHVDIGFDAAGPQVLTLGAQLNIDDIEDRYLGYDRELDATYSVFGAYAQHSWILAKWAETVVGARIDSHSELNNPIVSPRGALMLRPTPWLRLRSSVSTGFRAPQAFDEDLHIETVGGSPRIVVNDPNLDPERSLSVSQQAQVVTKLNHGEDLRFGINGYTTRLNNAFVLNEEDNPNTPEEELLRSNRGTTTVLGAELEASYQTPSFALRAGWTMERATNDEADEDFGRKRIFRTPRHYGYTDALVRLGALQIQSGVELTGPMLVPRYDANADPLEVNTSPWFANWSVNVSWAELVVGEATLELFAGARNILDSRQNDLDRGPDRDATYIYGPAQPRTLFGGVRGSL